MNMQKLKPFLKDNAPYMLAGVCVALIISLGRWAKMWGIQSYYANYLDGMNGLDARMMNLIYYGTEFLAAVIVIALIYGLFRVGRIARPLAHTFMGVGVYYVLFTGLPLMAWRLFAGLNMPAYLLLDLLFGIAAFLISRWLVSKLRQDIAVYMLGATLIILAHVLPVLVAWLMFSGTNLD